MREWGWGDDVWHAGGVYLRLMEESVTTKTKKSYHKIGHPWLVVTTLPRGGKSTITTINIVFYLKSNKNYYYFLRNRKKEKVIILLYNNAF